MSRGKAESEFIKSFEESIYFHFPKNGYICKIPDKPTKNQHKKDFDAFAGIDGVTFAIEFKAHHSDKPWPLSKVKEHQIEKLKKASDSGYESLILTEVKTEKEHFISFIVIDFFIALSDKGEKSVSISALKAIGSLAKESKYWNIEEFVEYFR